MPVDPSAIATWANLVTVGRVLIAPLMFWLIPEQPGVTTFGTFLDPLADKVLVLGAMFTLVSRDVFWVVPVVVIAGRELAISLYRTFVGAKGVSVPASKIAKWKTVAQQLSVGFAIAPLTALDATWLWKGLLWVSVALALISGGQYLWRARGAKRTLVYTDTDTGPTGQAGVGRQPV